MHDFQVSTARRPANGYAGAVSPRTIFSWIHQDFLHLFLHGVTINVQFSRGWIELEAKVHLREYTREPTGEQAEAWGPSQPKR